MMFDLICSPLLSHSVCLCSVIFSSLLVCSLVFYSIALLRCALLYALLSSVMLCYDKL